MKIAGNIIDDKLLMYGVVFGVVAIYVLPRLAIKTLVDSANDVVDSSADFVLRNSPLPDTRTVENKTICQQALDAGDDWKASFYCPAATWFGGLWDGK